MKIYHWINKYNYKVNSKTVKQYAEGIQSGRSTFYSLSFSFWDNYLLRFILVITSILSIKKTAYQAFYKIISSRYSPFFSADENPIIYIKLRNLIATLFGYRYFVNDNLLPLLNRKDILSKKLVVNAKANPLITIVIIDVENRLDYLYNCLKSINNAVSDKYGFEVIVSNDGSNPHINSFLKNTKEISHLIHPKGEVFSLDAKTLTTELICLVSSDSQVQEQWLETLVLSMAKGNIGCVGSKIIGKNGILIEAGNMIDHNGTNISLGRNCDINHPEFNYQKEVEYCSADSLIFKREDFIKLKFADTLANLGKNICQSVRKDLGKKVIYQPLSKIISFKETSKNSTGSTEGTFKYQPIKTILFIDDVVSAPDQDSGSNRIFEIMKLVKSLGYHVMFLPADGEKRGAYFNQMILEGFEVLYRFPNRQGMIKILKSRIGDIDMVWLCKPHNSEQFKFIFDLNKNCKWIYDTIDLHFLRLRREGELANDETILKLANEIKAIELNLAKQANVTLAITEDEKLMLENEKIENVEVVPNIHESKTSQEYDSFDERNGLLFIGGYKHKPNIDAVNWLVKEIMPIVWKSNPEINLTLLGSNPTDEVLALQSDRIIVPGYIHDVSSYFNQSRLFVAPLRFGAGMKGKIGQSLEFGLPIVSTYIGVEGMNLIDGHNVIVANKTNDFAEKIIQLYNSGQYWSKIRANAINALQVFTPEVVKINLKKILDTLNQS
jgi:glycosyltransferase involved in cell wall biosynthesis